MIVRYLGRLFKPFTDCIQSRLPLLGQAVCYASQRLSEHPLVRWPQTFTGSVRQLSVSGGPALLAFAADPASIRLVRAGPALLILVWAVRSRQGMSPSARGRNRAGRWGVLAGLPTGLARRSWRLVR